MPNHSTRIAAIDDDPALRQIIGHFLKDTGMEILTYESAEKALAELPEKDVSAILLDMEMPGMTGLEACWKIREHPALKEIPVIFLSATEDRTKIVHALTAGGNDYIIKPFHTHELLARIEAHVTVFQQKNRLEEQRRVLEKRNEENIILSTRSVMLQEVIRQYLPKSTWEKADLSAGSGMIEIPDEQIELAIFFLDIESFTAFSETRSASEVISALNEILGPVVDLLLAGGLDIDKFIGDSVFATSRDPVRALESAIQVRDKAAEINKARIARGEPSLAVRIGMHYGRVIRGNVGGNGRKENAIIGDAVNTASRIERACQPGKVLASETLALMAESRIEISPRLELKAKGKKEKIAVRYIRRVRI